MLLARSDVDLAYGDLQSLRGKTLGVTAPGTGPDVFLRYFVKSAGLDADRDVSITAVGTNEAMLASLQTRQVEVVIANEPAATRAVEEGLAKPVLDVAKDGPGLSRRVPAVALVATPDWIEAHRDTARRVIRAQVRANNELRANPRQGVEVARKYFANVDAELAEGIVNRLAPYWVSVITEDEIAAAAELNRDLGTLTQDVSYESVTVPSELRELWK
jgi:ABC-type nitrate/sulfonate/bicarbonate transport system substrate-binding protein